MKPGLISYQAALGIIQQQSRLLLTEALPLAKARGHFLAEEFKAPFPLPRFINAGLDGFALVASHTHAASTTNPISIAVVGSIAAGQIVSHAPLRTPAAFEINTGAPLPNGYDTVLPIEEAIYSSTPSPYLTITTPLKSSQNIRQVGSDVKTGQFLLSKGQPLQAAALAVLAAFGQDTVKTSMMPTLHFLATGDELLSFPHQAAMTDGKIYNSSLPIIDCLCAELSLPFKAYPPMADRAELWQQNIERIILKEKPGLIITTGAVSKGKYDLIPSIIEKMGGQILFHGVAIRPGKPILFAELPNGHYFFGLPGNPVSTLIGFRFFIVPFLRHLLGQPQEQPLTAVLTNDYHKNSRLKQFLKAYGAIDHQAQFKAEILTGQESFKIQPLLKTNGWIIADEGDSVLSAGIKKEFYPWLPA